jgi:hypothetical protein
MKNAKISEMINKKVIAGMSVSAAYDAVLGEGAYNRMVGELYDALKTKENIKAFREGFEEIMEG